MRASGSPVTTSSPNRWNRPQRARRCRFPKPHRSRTRRRLRPPSPEPQPLTDDIAKQEIKGTDIERPEYSAVVTHCEELKQERRLFFFMENGQIWRQSNAGRLNFRARDCQFDVTVKKDMFGWILHVPSENERVRVKRVR